MIKKFIKKYLKKEFSLDPSNQNDKKIMYNKEIIKKSKKYNIKFITCFDDKLQIIGEETSKTVKRYCDKFSYKFENIKVSNTERPPAWNKIKILKDQMLKNDSDFLMWIDADAFFNNFDIDINSQIEEDKDIYLVKHFCEVHKGSIYENTKLTILRINTGVILLRVSEFVKEFLHKVWENKSYINHPWWEQASVMDIIGFRSELNGNLNDNKGNHYLEKIKFLPNEWNSIPSNLDLSMEKQEPIIVHLAGMNNEDRANYLKKNKIV
tara:strand:- start:2548 stop:3345 length:798 start_codon:yes stop_codon:yes gene_type:complete